MGMVEHTTCDVEAESAVDFRGVTFAGTEVELDFDTNTAWVDGEKKPFARHYELTESAFAHGEFDDHAGDVTPFLRSD